MGSKHSFLEIFLFLLIGFSNIGYAVPFSKMHTESLAEKHERLFADLPFHETPYFLVILVDAKHFDYTNCGHLLRSLVKHPRVDNKTREVGHAWILLRGIRDGLPIEIEGGHSGELGEKEPKYLEGVANLLEFGYINPKPEQMRHPRYEPNPVRYLWEELHDGFFQKGSGGHLPTYAAKIDLTEQQFLAILQFIHPRSYNYATYSLTQNQCCTLAVQVARLAGLTLQARTSIKLDKVWKIGKSRLRLWQDLSFSTLSIETPDRLEKSLGEAVMKGQAQYALPWYTETHLKIKPF